MKLVLNKLVYYVNREKEKKRTILENSHNMLNGEYIFSSNKKYVYLNDEKVKSKSKWLIENDPLHHENKLILKIVNLFINKNFVIKKVKCQFKGSIYFFSANHERDRIFDVDSFKVKVLFKNSEDLEKYIENYNKFVLFFNQPELLSFDSETITEELVSFDDSWRLNSEIITQIIDDFIRYYKVVDKNDIDRVLLKTLFKKLKNDRELDFFKENINHEFLSNEIITIDGHGDLRKNNILYNSENKKTYYIDWEFSKRYSLNYDLFFLMYHEATYNNNYFLINKYAKGDFDEKFSCIYNMFDENFDQSLRKQYLVAFMLEHYLKKSNCNLKIIERYKNILENIFENNQK